MPLSLTPPLQSWLSARIALFAADTDEPEDRRALASHHLVLPLAIDWTAFWGLRADGEILVVNTEGEIDPTIELDDRIRRMALSQGSLRYSELLPLVPARPAEAVDCPPCRGTGVVYVPGCDADNLVCYCGGLGWLFPPEAAAISTAPN